jgi:heme exporter protein A
LRWQLSLDQYGAAPIGDQALESALERCGIGQQRHLPFAVLSAGQRRRLAMSRLVLSLQGAGHQQRLCWLLDEPSTALDDQGQALMGSLLGQLLNQRGFAIIATHGAIPHAPPALTCDLGA